MEYKEMETKERQYSYLYQKKKNDGLETLGMMSNGVWQRDPKRLAFYLSRYKFVSKIFEGRKNVLEIGCGDAFASRIVRQSVENLTVCDFDPLFIEDARERHSDDWPLRYEVCDYTSDYLKHDYDGIYLLDVFEHIPPQNAPAFIKNVKKSMNTEGALIIGIPSLESQDLIPEDRKDPGHVNCMSGIDFRLFLLKSFHNVFLFSMNDEVVHTGHTRMAHYLICLCTNPKKNEF
jgi:SAM-dependent methyltransferase